MNPFSSSNCNCANGFQSNTPKNETLCDAKCPVSPNEKCGSSDASYASVYGASK